MNFANISSHITNFAICYVKLLSQNWHKLNKNVLAILFTNPFLKTPNLNIFLLFIPQTVYFSTCILMLLLHFFFLTANKHNISITNVQVVFWKYCNRKIF